MRRILLAAIGVFMLGVPAHGDAITLIIRNIADSQTLFVARPSDLGEVIWIVHHAETEPIFSLGEIASRGLERFAEGSETNTIFADLSANPDVIAFGIMPGGNLEEGCETVGIINIFSEQALTIMVPALTANDKFWATPPAGLRVFNSQGYLIESQLGTYMNLFDAGTEIDEPPGYGRFQFAAQNDPDEGYAQKSVVVRMRTGQDRSQDGFAYPKPETHLEVILQEDILATTTQGKRCPRRRPAKRGRESNIFG